MEVKEFAVAALQVLSSAKGIDLATTALIDVAADGVIDESEKPTIESILETLGVASKKIMELELICQKLL